MFGSSELFEASDCPYDIFMKINTLNSCERRKRNSRNKGCPLCYCSRCHLGGKWWCAKFWCDRKAGFLAKFLYCDTWEHMQLMPCLEGLYFNYLKCSNRMHHIVLSFLFPTTVFFLAKISSGLIDHFLFNSFVQMFVLTGKL